MTKQKIKDLCEKYDIENYTINDDMSIDVDGDVSLNNYGLFELPLTFRKVTGYFDCLNNQLTTLKGAPIEVGEHFDANNNYLTNLDYLPKKIEEDIYIANNKLTSLKGLPEVVYGDVYCTHNKLTNFEGSPKEVYGTFTCAGNDITSLKGCPEFIEKDFSINKNKVTSFEYGPKKIGNNYFAGQNPIFNMDGFETEFGGKLFLEGNTPIGLLIHKVDNECVNFFKKIKVVKGKELNIKRLQYLGTMFSLPRDYNKLIEKYYTIV